MKNILIAVTALGLTWNASTAFAEDEAPAPVHFISINMIAEGGNDAFDAYTENVLPIMHAHNSDFTPLTVVNVLGGDLTTNAVVTFGQFGSRADSQAFNQDPDFQAIFPDLAGALDDHLVIFPDGAVPSADQLEGESDLFLSFIWSDTAAENVHAFNEQVNQDLADVIAAHHGERLGVWRGRFASQGLGADMAPTEAPQLIELWRFSDLNAFLADAHEISLPEPPFAITRQLQLQIESN